LAGINVQDVQRTLLVLIHSRQEAFLEAQDAALDVVAAQRTYVIQLVVVNDRRLLAASRLQLPQKVLADQAD